MAEEQANEAGESESNRAGAGASGSDAGSLRRANAQQARVNRLERLRSNGDSSLMGQVVHKVCCVCGCDLTHKMRFKDGSGKYWCSLCNDADHERTRPAPCSDCGIEMPRGQLVEVHGRGQSLLLCPVCNEKRLKAEGSVQVRTPAAKLAAPAPAAASTAPTIPLLPLVFAVAAVIMAIIIILLALG